MLEKLRVEFTKSRPRHSNDNALAESKNASVVRKHLGYAHIPQYCASLVNAFCAAHLNPYVMPPRAALPLARASSPKRSRMQREKNTSVIATRK